MNNFKVTDVRAVPGDSAFLIEYKNTAVLYDTGFAFTGYKVSDNIKKILGERKLDAILLTHSHYDHAAGTPYILKRYKDAKVIAGEYAVGIFKKDSAKSVMRDLDSKFAKKCGIDKYDDLFDKLKVDTAVKDGDKFTIKDITFTAISLPGHTRCSFGFYIEELKLLFSSETLGVYNGIDTVVPSFLIGVQTAFDSIDKVLSLDIEQMVLPHYGLISKETTRLFLTKAKSNAEEAVDGILKILKSGKSKEEALKYFKDKYYHGYIKEIYPIDAMELNTRIMIDLIIKEKLS